MNDSFDSYPVVVPGFLLAVFVIGYSAYLWLIRDLFFGPDHWLVVVGMTCAGFFMIGSMLNIVYGLFMMYCVVPRLDPVVDPGVHWHIQRYGDNQFHRFHRAVFYCGSATWAWANRRLMPQYDFSQLPWHARVLLVGGFYCAATSGVCMLIGAAALECAERLGYL